MCVCLFNHACDTSFSVAVDDDSPSNVNWACGSGGSQPHRNERRRHSLCMRLICTRFALGHGHACLPVPVGLNKYGAGRTHRSHAHIVIIAKCSSFPYVVVSHNIRSNHSRASTHVGRIHTHKKKHEHRQPHTRSCYLNMLISYPTRSNRRNFGISECGCAVFFFFLSSLQHPPAPARIGGSFFVCVNRSTPIPARVACQVKCSSGVQRAARKHSSPNRVWSVDCTACVSVRTRAECKHSARRTFFYGVGRIFRVAAAAGRGCVGLVGWAEVEAELRSQPIANSWALTVTAIESITHWDGDTGVCDMRRGFLSVCRWLRLHDEEFLCVRLRLQIDLRLAHI